MLATMFQDSLQPIATHSGQIYTLLIQDLTTQGKTNIKIGKL